MFVHEIIMTSSFELDVLVCLHFLKYMFTHLGGGAVGRFGALKPHNHTSWVDAVTPTKSHKAVRKDV